MSNLEIRLFGGLEIRSDGAALTGFISSKAPALLAYLAVSGRTRQREALAGLFWGEMPDAAAANNLRQALTNLRKLAGPHLEITRDSVAFNRSVPYSLDVETFRDLLRLSGGQPPVQRAGLLRQALALYQGEFLEGFYVRDAPDFEDWALVQRVQLRELALQGWDALTALLLNSGEFERAVEAAGRLLAMDPWREEAHRQRMLALARSGQFSAALAQYQTCRGILRREFDAEPSGETTALFERIRAAMRGPRHNLPAATTGFVGRETELAELRRLLAAPDTRLLTILGPGGVGKTRLAVEAAAVCGPMFLNGVCFVPLATTQADQPNALAAAIADALQLTLSGEAGPRQQVLDFLRPRESLLLLDNLEHLLDSAAWLSQLLADAPDVKILATSRARLDLQAERVFPLDGLSLPAQAVPKPASSAAVQLFIRRANRVQAGFALTSENSAAIVRICRLVEGLPLGIELAAAWVNQLDCREIAQEIAANLDFLATGRRDVSPRQRSLRATFDWSWGRLAPGEQQALRRMTVFQGPFSRAAAGDVADASLSILATLVDKSLIWRRGDVYLLHEIVRHFAGEELRLAEKVQDTQDRHAHFYAQLLRQSKPKLQGHQQQSMLTALDLEIDNVRAAWHWLATRQDAAGLDVATDGFYPYLMIRSRFREGLESFREARLALEPGSTSDRCHQLIYNRVKAREGRFLSSLSQYGEAVALLEEALEELRALDASADVAFVLNHLGGTARVQGMLDLAEERLQECLTLHQASSDMYGEAVAWLEVAGVSFMRGDFETARARCQEGLALAESVGDLQTAAHLLTGLSLSLRELGNFEAAQSYGRRSLAIYEELEDSYGLLQACLTLGELSRQTGDYQAARDLCLRAVQLSEEIGDRSGEADGRYRLGQIAAGLGQRQEALREQRLALELAREISQTPLVIDILLEISCLLAEGKDDQVRGVTILRFLIDQGQLSAGQRVRAQGWLAGRPDRATGRRGSLDEVVALAW